jgi:hypothetical protein
MSNSQAVINQPHDEPVRNSRSRIQQLVETRLSDLFEQNNNSKWGSTQSFMEGV